MLQVLSFCEHGELSKLLRKRAADGDMFHVDEKHRFCAEISAGMAHLGAHNFVHRDLAVSTLMTTTVTFSWCIS